MDWFHHWKPWAFSDSFDTTWTVSLKFGELTRKHWDVHVKNSDEKFPKNMFFSQKIWCMYIYINMYIRWLHLNLRIFKYTNWYFRLPPGRFSVALSNSGLCSTVFFYHKRWCLSKGNATPVVHSGAPQAGTVPIRWGQVGRNQIPFNKQVPCLQWDFQDPIYWRYLPYIRPIFQAYVREHPHKIWPNIWYSTSILGSWNSHWSYMSKQEILKSRSNTTYDDGALLLCYHY